MTELESDPLDKLSKKEREELFKGLHDQYYSLMDGADTMIRELITEYTQTKKGVRRIKEFRDRRDNIQNTFIRLSTDQKERLPMLNSVISMLKELEKDLKRYRV